MTQSIIAANARVAQEQDAYQKRCNGLVKRYDTAKARYNEVVDAISEMAMAKRCMAQGI